MSLSLLSCRIIVQHFCVGCQISIHAHLAELLDSQPLFFEVRFVFCAQVCRFALYFALKAVPPPTLQFYFWHRAFTLCREIHSCARSTVPLRETASSSRNEYVMRSSPRERYRSMPCTHGRRECGSCKRWILCILLSGYLSVHCAFLCCMH